MSASGIKKRPERLHVFKVRGMVLVHSCPELLWSPIYREIRNLESWGNHQDEKKVNSLRHDESVLRDLYVRAQDAIVKLERKKQKAQGDLDEEEELYPEEARFEGMFQDLWCSVELNKLPERTVRMLIQHDLDEESTKLVAEAFYEVEPTVEALSKVKVEGCHAMSTLLHIINKIHDGRWATTIGSHPYKVTLEFEYKMSWFSESIKAVIPIRYSNTVFFESRKIDNSFFFTKHGAPIRRTPLEVLEEMDLESCGALDEEDNKLLHSAKEMSNQVGLQVATKGDFMTRGLAFWSSGIDFRAHGTPEKPQKAIVEPELGLDRGYEERELQNANDLPFVRVFSLERKKYGYFDVRDLSEYEFDRGLLDQLVMPQAKKAVLTSVISAEPGSVMADIVRGKHGGFVVLAAGPTGVGKTLTAEAVSEWLERPLYAVEVAELGTDVDQLEETLSEIFLRASRWNAILLFDEADVFLATRDLNLERSAIVGVFLRLMDYHDGVIFMTTNRADIIDPAMFSRLAMVLEYKNLKRAARKKVWNVMLGDSPKLAALGPALSRLPLNGRQIRNTARVIRALNSQRKTGTISESEAMEVSSTATRCRLTLWRRFMAWLGY